jgi:TonB-linked SusC/RagA family outer membrane protein
MKFSAKSIAVSERTRRYFHQFLLVMKLTTFLLIIAFLQVSAKGFSQITLHEKNASLEQIFSAIERQTNFVFLYDEQKLHVGPLNIDVNNASLQETLARLFKGYPVDYSIVEKNVLVKSKETMNSVKANGSAKLIDVVGHIFGQEGKPLRGANVFWRKGQRGATTDENGGFNLMGVDEKAIFEISFVGYLTKEVKANSDLGHVTLEQKDSKLDAVQVIAYGSNTKRFSIGSATTVTSADIENQPVTNVLSALQGRVPGLVVTEGSGAPGAAVRIQIRGQNTLRTSTSDALSYNQPLFIIDGVPFAPQNHDINLFQSLGAASTVDNAQLGMSPFNNINPADIESITVLRDADATSIYGTQGLNGVILITTKKGKPGKTSFSGSLDKSVNSVARPMQMLNTQQYLDLRKEAATNDGITPAQYDTYSFPDLTVFDQNKYTDFYKQFFNKTASTTRAHGSLTGGTNTTNFIFSGGYSRSDYNFPGDYADQTYTLHTAVHHSAFNDRLTFDFGTDYSYDRNNTSGNPNVVYAYLTPPNMPDLIDSKGNLVWNYKGVDISSYQQYAYLKQLSLLQSYNLNTNLRIGVKIIDGLKFTANLGYSRFSTEQNTTSPLDSQNPAYFNESSAQFGNNTLQTLNIEPQLDYERQIGKGILTALLGSQYKKNEGYNSTILASDYANDALLGSLDGATYLQANDNSSLYKYSAGFARIGYVYDQKYIVSLTGRRDGSSNFGPGRQFGNFGSAGLGWIFSEEQGFKTLLPFVSYAKLSGSYGTTGGDGISPYQYQAYWQAISNASLFQNTRPYQPLNLYNPDYSWSTKKALNVSMDMGFLNNRILVNATWYQDKTSNQLVGYTLPVQTGFNNVLENLDATIQDKGWEFTLNSTNIKSKDFNWTTTFNISFNRNQVTAFPGLESSSYSYNYVLGQSTNVVLGYKYKGVNPSTGLYEFYKANGEITSNPVYGLASQGSGDLQVVADLQPKFFGGIGNNFSYKNFSLFAFFQFSKQQGYNYLYSMYSRNAGPGSYNNVPVAALDHWRKPGDISAIQKVTTGADPDASNAAYNFVNSSGAISDASYIRLKTLSLGYTFPEAVFKKAYMQNFKVYVNAQNLLTITGYKVGDPESAGNIYSFPLQRTISFGLSFNY